MANKFFRKLNGLLTAAALCVSCLPFGGMLSASAADVQETIPGMTQSPEQLIQEADRGDFLTLGYAVMLECSYGGVGFASTLSEKSTGFRYIFSRYALRGQPFSQKILLKRQIPAVCWIYGNTA